MKQNRILAIDPGTAKCGVAEVAMAPGGNAQICMRKVVQIADLGDVLRSSVEGGVDVVVVGGGTGSKPVVKLIEQSYPELGVLVVDEHGSSELARARYWQENPPRGWRRLVPRGMLSPPESYDDFAAVLLAESVLAEMQHE